MANVFYIPLSRAVDSWHALSHGEWATLEAVAFD